MTIRSSSSSIISALVFVLVAASTVLSRAQTAAPADTSSSNAAPPAPTAPAAAAPATAAPEATTPAPADTNTAPATATTPMERPSTYTIVKGDSLWSIAHKFGTNVVKLRKTNNLKKGALLHPGQVLQIPPAPTDTK